MEINPSILDHVMLRYMSADTKTHTHVCMCVHDFIMRNVYGFICSVVKRNDTIYVLGMTQE